MFHVFCLNSHILQLIIPHYRQSWVIIKFGESKKMVAQTCLVPYLVTGLPLFYHFRLLFLSFKCAVTNFGDELFTKIATKRYW